MSVERLIAELRERDIALWVDGGRLRFSAPPGAMTDALRERLAANRGALRNWLLASRTAGEDAFPPIVRIDRDGELPLSYAQERLWFIDQLETGGAAYNIAMALSLRGDLEVTALAHSFESVIARHEILRSRVVTDRHRPVLQLDTWEHFDLPVIALHGSDGGDPLHPLGDAIQREIAIPFDLGRDRLLRARLLRIREREHVLVVVVHHIVADAWSMGILLSELSGFYCERVTGNAYQPPPLPVQYVDYAAWQRDPRNLARFDAQIGYWRERLQGLALLELPADRARPTAPTGRGASEGFVIDGGLLQDCRELCRRQQVTPFVLMLAVFKVLLQRYTDASDVAVGIPVAGRTAPGTGQLVGCFLNTLVLRTDLSGAPAFGDLLARVRQTATEGQAHQDVPFERVLQELETERNLGRSPLFQVLFNYIDISNATLDLAGLQVSRVDAAARYTKFDLTCYVYAGPEQLTVTFDYALDLFDADTVRAMLRHYRNLLASAVAQPSEPVDRLAMRDAADRRRDRERGAAAILGAVRGQTLVEVFADHARARPQQAAVTTADRSISRGELHGLADRAAVRIGEWFAAHGRHAPGRVGLVFEDALDMVAAMLAVMKAGHALVPLDAAAPAARLAAVAADADLALIIAADALGGVAVQALPEVLRWSDLAGDPAKGAPAPGYPGADSAAYLLYTSGSTGTPKGVLQTHRGLLHHATAFCSALALSPDDRLSLLSAFTFDTAIQDICAALYSGATLCAVNLRDARPAAARDTIEARAISVLHMTPTVFRHLFGERAHGKPMASVRAVVIGGETARPGDHALYRRHFSAGCALVNGLGATECSTALQYRMDHDTLVSGRALPVGSAVPGVEVVLLDAAGNETDVFGEIAVIGVPTGTAYWKDAVRTAQRFRATPGGDAASQMYLTGDLGSRRADGNIRFEGRRDQQVKLRGMRVELTEVEAVLDAHADVRRAVVALAGEPGSELLLAACEPRETGAAIDADALRAYLRGVLPEYMIPARIVTLEALPLTASGKLDRRGLAALAGAAGDKRSAAVPPAPRSELEQAIAAIWQQVLGLDVLPLRRNFFDLGGHSLLLVEVRARLEELTGNAIAMPVLFQYPTVEALAAYLSPAPRTAATGPGSVPRGRLPGDAPIAIIAMAARLPGAADLDTFWRNLRDGVETIELADVDALIADGLDPRLARDPRFVPAHSSVAGVELFDADFFGYTPREAELMDPQHRLFLECAVEALERAGCDPQRDPGPIGVFAGAGMTNYLFNLIQRPDLVRASGGWQAVIRADKDYLPLRVSYKLNLRGPSIDVQTACSTSLVAVHQACNSLLRFDCDLALAGGVTLRYPRHPGYLHEEGGILSPDGHCRAFDAQAGGTVFGEGAGVVVLKRLDDALRDGDPIRAVIRGTAVNNDGSDKVGFTAPSVGAQAALVADAHAHTGVEASSIGYMEAHGTATTLGDPIEVAALNEAFRGTPRGSCALASVKSNIGHLDRAAGVAGLMKAVLALEHGEIPPSLHYQRANPEIDFEAGPFYVPTALTPWARVDGQPRRAGVSSFGMGGTNAHAVLEEAPARAASGPSRRWQVLPVSAKSAAALEAACGNLAAHLEAHPQEVLADVAYTLQVGADSVRAARGRGVRGRGRRGAGAAGGGEAQRGYGARRERDGGGIPVPGSGGAVPGDGPGAVRRGARVP